MKFKNTRNRKPNLLVLLTLFVSAAVLATSVAQAGKLQTWKPEFTVGKDGQGLNLARPFGTRGPTLRVSNTMPDEVKRCLRAGGDRQIGALASDNPDAYMFLEKRW